LAQEGEVELTKKISRKEKEQIKALFAPHTPLCNDEDGIENALKEYTAKTAITRKMIKNQRDGQAAGTRDVLAVGPVKKK